MNRRNFLKLIGSVALLPVVGTSALAAPQPSRLPHIIHATVTGRTSSKSPSFGNIPKSEACSRVLIIDRELTWAEMGG